MCLKYQLHLLSEAALLAVQLLLQAQSLLAKGTPHITAFVSEAENTDRKGSTCCEPQVAQNKSAWGAQTCSTCT